MKNLSFLSFLLILSACTTMKRVQTSMSHAVAGSERIEVGGHEVYCSEGKVCSEIDVIAIAVEDRDGGKVRVTLRNRTPNTALIQIRLATKSPQGEVLTETRPENFVLPPTQEKSYEMPGVARKGATIRVLLTTAY